MNRRDFLKRSLAVGVAAALPAAALISAETPQTASGLAILHNARSPARDAVIHLLQKRIADLEKSLLATAKKELEKTLSTGTVSPEFEYEWKRLGEFKVRPV